MKYFTLEFMDKLSNMLNPEYKECNKLWQENLIAYWSQFENYKNKLPSRFVKEYCKHGFHDYNIESIIFYRDDKKIKDCFSIELKLCFDSNKYLIKYIGVTKYTLNVDVENSFYNNTFLYSEILPIENIKMSHEILLENRNTVQIIFNKLVFKKIIL